LTFCVSSARAHTQTVPPANLSPVCTIGRVVCSVRSKTCPAAHTRRPRALPSWRVLRRRWRGRGTSDQIRSVAYHSLTRTRTNTHTHACTQASVAALEGAASAVEGAAASVSAVAVAAPGSDCSGAGGWRSAEPVFATASAPRAAELLDEVS
jgi:hypothetical protein